MGWRHYSATRSSTHAFRRIEPFYGHSQVSVVRNRIPQIDRFGLVTGQFHRDRAGYASAFQISHGGPAQIVRNPAGTSGFATRGLEHLGERGDRLGPQRSTATERDHPEEYPRHDTFLLFQPFVLGVLRF